MGQNTKIGQGSYRSVTVPVSEKEEVNMRYNALLNEEIKAHKKHERRLFFYHAALVVTLITIAFVKEKFYPSHIEWIDWVMAKIQSL